MLQNWRVWTPTETGREHAMVKIPPMMGSGIQRRHAAIFGESPENIDELRKSDSKWMVLKMNGLSKTEKWTVKKWTFKNWMVFRKLENLLKTYRRCREQGLQHT